MANEAVIGLVLEIGVLRGVDLLAVYANRTARLQRSTGAAIDWRRPDASLDAQLDGLLTAANEAFDETALMDPRDAPAVRFGEARLALLTPDLVRGAQGSVAAWAGSPRLGQVLRHGSMVMQALVAHLGAVVAR